MRMQKSPSQTLAENIGVITQNAVEISLTEMRTSFEAFRTDIQNQVLALFPKSQPILHVKIGDLPKTKLSTRVNPILPRLITNAKLGMHTMLVGPAGCGKTTAASQLAESLALPFGSVCLTAGASETWLFGRQTPNGFVEGQFSKLYRDGGVFLIDEMDAADANLLLSINTALSHNHMLNPMSGETIHRHANFHLIAAANTNGKGSTNVYTGRSRLDAATLDRFVIILMEYDHDLERDLCPNDNLYSFLQSLRTELRSSEMDEFISTRAFDRSYRQLTAGIDSDDIINSLIANWSDAAKDKAKSLVSTIKNGSHDTADDKPTDHELEKPAPKPGKRKKSLAETITEEYGTEIKPVKWKNDEIPF